MNRYLPPFVVITLLVILAGCSLMPGLPPATQTPLPTATATLPAATPEPATSTSTATPTNTVVMPSTTSLPLASQTPSSTPGYTIGHITATPAGGTPKPKIAEYSCYQTLQLPAIGERFHIRDEFDAHWQIVNRDIVDWLASETVVYYANGTKLQTYTDKIKLPHDVKPGKAVDIIIDMTVPAEPGFYTTSWIVANKERVICILTVSINAY